MKVRALPDRPDRVRVLQAWGEMDLTVVPAVVAGLQDLVAGAPAVVLDLSAVSFFDSSGVRLVDQLARICGGAGAAFRVAAPPESAGRRVLEIVGMGALLTDTLGAAVSEVRP
jgi:anti-anti-sigma factor